MVVVAVEAAASPPTAAGIEAAVAALQVDGDFRNKLWMVHKAMMVKRGRREFVFLSVFLSLSLSLRVSLSVCLSTSGSFRRNDPMPTPVQVFVGFEA